MKIATIIIVSAYLIIGSLSLLLLFGTFYYIVFKNKTINAFYCFWEYANKKELLLMKVGRIGFGVAILLFFNSGYTRANWNSLVHNKPYSTNDESRRTISYGSSPN